MPSAPDQPVVQLQTLIGAAQVHDPLAPVTVVVPGNLCGLWLRYELGAGMGLANVRFTSVAQLADLIAAPALAESGRSALSPLKAQRVVKELLNADPGWFGEAARSPATIDAVAVALGKLRSLAPDRRREFAGAGAGAARRRSLVGLLDRFEEATADVYDAHDALAVATAECRRPFTRAALGTVIDYCAGDLSEAASVFLAALGPIRISASPADVFADVAHVQLVSAPDPSGEVRVVLGWVASLIDSGLPLAEIAVVHPGIDPWARTAIEELEAAGIPTSGRSASTLAQTEPGRVLLGLYDLDARGYSLDAVTSLLLCAPISLAGRSEVIPAAKWVWHARQAGVTRGVENWRSRLQQRAVERVKSERTVKEIEEFTAFLDEVFPLSPLSGRKPAREWADRSIEALHRYAIKSDDSTAFVGVEGALASIGSLGDEILDAAEYRHLLTAALNVPAGRTGVFGAGVFVGTVDELVGAGFSAVAVVGSVEGVFGRVEVGDGVLLAADRAEIDPGSDSRAAQQRAQQMLRRAVNEAERALVTFPRADTRMGRKQVPATVVVELAKAIAAARGGEAADGAISARSLATQSSTPWLTSVDSRVLDLARTDAPASLGEARLRRGADLGTNDPEVQRGHDAREARASDAFTAFDGLAYPHGATDVTAFDLSATRLETYAKCPRRYFFEYELRLRDAEPIEITEEITGRDHGSVVHNTVDALFKAGPRPVDAGEPWPQAAIDQVAVFAQAEFDRFRNKGQAGERLPARIREARIVSDIVSLFRADDADRAAGGWLQVHSEHRFGRDDTPPVEVSLPDGSAVRFAGVIDRIDLSADGERVRVIDYKTGNPETKTEVTKGMATGERLQAYIYAQAARQLYPGAEVTFEYWFVRNNEVTPVPIGSSLLGLDALGSVLVPIVDGIAQGLYPGRPGPDGANENCNFCSVKAACDSDREEHWIRKRHDPRLAAYTAQVDPPTEQANTSEDPDA